MDLNYVENLSRRLKQIKEDLKRVLTLLATQEIESASLIRSVRSLEDAMSEIEYEKRKKIEEEKILNNSSRRK